MTNNQTTTSTQQSAFSKNKEKGKNTQGSLLQSVFQQLDKSINQKKQKEQTSSNLDSSFFSSKKSEYQYLLDSQDNKNNPKEPKPSNYSKDIMRKIKQIPEMENLSNEIIQPEVIIREKIDQDLIQITTYLLLSTFFLLMDQIKETLKIGN